MMTGVPVNRIAQTESTKLAALPERIKGKVIGQDDAVQKITKSDTTKQSRIKRSQQTDWFIYIFRSDRGRKNTTS